jgi:hypothetical protein
MGLQVQITPDGKYTPTELENLVRELKLFVQGKEVMDREETAEFLGMSVWNVDRLARQGHIKAHYLGSSKLFLRSEIITAIKNS